PVRSERAADEEILGRSLSRGGRERLRLEQRLKRLRRKPVGAVIAQSPVVADAAGPGSGSIRRTRIGVPPNMAESHRQRLGAAADRNPGEQLIYRRALLDQVIEGDQKAGEPDLVRSRKEVPGPVYRTGGGRIILDGAVSERINSLHQLGRVAEV